MDETISKLSQHANKRRKHGRLSDATKKLKTQTHEIGEDCKCRRLKCFDKVSEQQRQDIVKNFNFLRDHDSQKLYLSGLIRVAFVKRKRIRKNQMEAKLHEHSYFYKVRVKEGESVKETAVCYKAFLSIHGITGRRLQTIQQQLAEHGKVLTDGRGKHTNRPNAMNEATRNKIHEHIQSLKGRNAHYSLKKSSEIYLPHELNIKKLHSMYLEMFPNFPASYDCYYKIFNSDYNIAFGYPRSDTCGQCDMNKAQMKQIEEELSRLSSSSDPGLIRRLTVKLRNLQLERELHLRKAQTFYDKKRNCRQECSKNITVEAIAMDFQKKLPVPNITSNIVYYKRQLSVHPFNIHALASGDSVFYCYDETIARKGADEVVSMLHHYIFNILSLDVKRLFIFCDSCPGQNKNFTLFRYIHYVVTVCGRLEQITVTYPERGHSYMECDRNMGIIPKNPVTEVPKDWYEVVKQCRVKPSPFQVLECDQSLFKDWTICFSSNRMYKRKFSVPSRPIKEIKVEKEHPRIISFRSGAYNMPWETSVICAPRNGRVHHKLRDGEFFLPGSAYSEHLPISFKKWKDLQELSTLLSEEQSKQFYASLPHSM